MHDVEINAVGAPAAKTCVVLLATGVEEHALAACLEQLILTCACQHEALFIVGAGLTQARSNSLSAGIDAKLAAVFQRVIENEAVDDAEFPVDCDIFLTCSGVVLPLAWDMRLAKAGTSDARLGAVSALDLASAPFAPNIVESQATGKLVERWDAAVYCLGDRAVYDTPMLSTACVQLRRAALDQLAVRHQVSVGKLIKCFDALQPRLCYLGWRTCVVDFCAVSSAGAMPSCSQHPQSEILNVYGELHPLRSLARAAARFVNVASRPPEYPGLDGRPVILHVLHSWGGGVRKWVSDFSSADPSRIHLLLTTVQVGKAGTQRLRLSMAGVPDLALRHWDLSMPIPSIAPSSVEYERILREIICDYSVNGLVVSSLIGHSLAALEQAVPTLVVCHDYLPVCQSISPFFGKECTSCSLENLSKCRNENPLNVEFRHVGESEWDALRHRFAEIVLGRQLVLVAPTRSVVNGLSRLDPRLSGARFEVVPHGLSMRPVLVPYRSLLDGEPLRLVVLGQLNPMKGENLLRELLARADNRLDIFLVGCGKRGEAIAAEFGVRAIPEYSPSKLSELMHSVAPHAGLLLSSVPESFSYTLSELFAMGIPPLATRLGAFAERIQDGTTGLLFEPESESLFRLLNRLLDSPELLSEIAENLRQQIAVRSASDMVRDYSAWLPTGPLPSARFAVNAGTRTALFADYEHLSDAYAHMADAYSGTKTSYAELEHAYRQVTMAYETTKESAQASAKEAASLRKLADQFFEDFSLLKLRRYWWRAPRTGRLVATFKDDINRLAQPECGVMSDTSVSER
jgi:glycosyltransferase involved in cell wall biosynthesis